MRILIITQLFPPEMGAQAVRMHCFARSLAAAGHDVFVATGMPNYPSGIVFPAYRGLKRLSEVMDGFTVLRTACFTAPRNHDKWSQMANYLSFVPAAVRSGWRAGHVDVIIVTSPPLFPAASAILLAKLRRAKLVVDLRDLWPDEIVACGVARPGSLAIRLISALERWAYRAADLVCATTASFIETVTQRGVPLEKTLLLPNGADVELFRPVQPDAGIIRELGAPGRFVVMYAGALGIKHGLEPLLEAANLLRDRSDIVFVLLGAGPRERELRRRAAELALQNVLFLGERPAADLPAALAAADVCVSSLLPSPYLEKIISVKIFEYLACGKPVIASQAGEGARIVTESRSGIVVSPGSARGIADAILELHSDPVRRTEMGERGRRFIEERYARRPVAARLERALVRMCEQSDVSPAPRRHPIPAGSLHVLPSAHFVDFDIHGVVGVRLVDPPPQHLAAASALFGRFRQKLERAPDVVLRFVPGLTARGLRYVDLKRTAFNDEGFFLVDNHGQPTARLKFEAPGGQREIELAPGTPNLPFLMEHVHLAALTKGFVPIHASAFAWNGIGVLVAGWPNAGKTGILLAFAAHGAEYVGDEWVLISQDGQLMYGLSQEISFSAWHVRQMNGSHSWPWRQRVAARLDSWFERADRMLRGNSIAHSLPLRRTASNIAALRRRFRSPLPAESVFGAMAQRPVTLDALFLCVNGPGDGVTLQPAQATDFAERSSSILRAEHSAFGRTYLAYRFAFPAGKNGFLEDAHERARQMALRAFQDKPAWLVLNPTNARHDDLFRAMFPAIQAVADQRAATMAPAS